MPAAMAHEASWGAGPAAYGCRSTILRIEPARYGLPLGDRWPAAASALEIARKLTFSHEATWRCRQPRSEALGTSPSSERFFGMVQIPATTRPVRFLFLVDRPRLGSRLRWIIASRGFGWRTSRENRGTRHENEKGTTRCPSRTKPNSREIITAWWPRPSRPYAAALAIIR